MAFSQATITEIFAPTWSGSGFTISWTSSSPTGVYFQVYVNRHLTWIGTARSASIPWPVEFINVAIGTVGPGEQNTDFSASLPSDPTNRVQLEWQGATFLADDTVGFHVYGSPSAGESINYSNILADIPAYPGGIILDGWGLGGWGNGGWGRSASYYSWISGPLTSGTWMFAVKSYDSAGNESTPDVYSATICVPPLEPAVFAGTTDRLHYTYDFPSKEVTLIWNASPG